MSDDETKKESTTKTIIEVAKSIENDRVGVGINSGIAAAMAQAGVIDNITHSLNAFLNESVLNSPNVLAAQVMVGNLLESEMERIAQYTSEIVLSRSTIADMAERFLAMSAIPIVERDAILPRIARLNDELINVEEPSKAIDAEVIEDVPNEQVEKLQSLLKQKYEEIALLKSEVGKLEKIIIEKNIEDVEVKKISKRGPQRYSDKEKLDALREWDALDKSVYPIAVRDWLINRFGEDGGIPNVAKSTFYGWKGQLRDKGIEI